MARSTRARGRAKSAAPRPSAPGRTDLVYALTHISIETRALLVILVGALTLRILPLGAFSTEYDEGVYWMSLRAMAHGHPLYSSVYSSQPPFFLLSLYPLFALFGQTMPAARFVVALYSLVGIAALYFIGKGLGRRYVGLAAAALLAVDPLYLQLSRTLQAEVPALAFMLVGIALAIAAARRRDAADRRTRTLLVVASGAILGLALMSKLLAIVGVVPAAIVLAWPGIVPPPSVPATKEKAPNASRAYRSRRKRPIGDWRTLVRAVWPDLALLLAGLIGACLLVVAPFLGSAAALYQQVIALHLAASRTTLGQSPLVNLRLIAGLGGEYWLAAAALVAIAAAIWRRSALILPGAAWALATLLLLVAQRPLWTHHVVFLIPPLALVAALLIRLAPPLRIGASRARTPTTTRLRQALKRPTIVTYGALILLGATFAVGLIVGIVQDQRAIEYQAGTQITEALSVGANTVPGDLVVSDDPYLVGLGGRDVPPELVDTSLVRVQTGDLTAKQLEAIIARDNVQAILFASGRFDLVPGFRTWVQQNFKVRQDFGGGHVLYVKEPPGPINV